MNELNPSHVSPIDNDSSAAARTEDTPCPLASARGKGWHAYRMKAPHRGIGTATVQPIRRRKDIEAIKRALAERPRDLALFIVGIHFGLRGSDLLALRWEDVTTGAAIREHVEITEQKTGKLRRIAVQQNARAALKAWHVMQQPQRADFVFPSRKGGRMTIQRLHQLVNEWAQLAGLRGNYGSHTLRKTYGYHLRMLGTDIVKIMTIFGHSNQAITLRYLGVEQDEIDQANEKLNL